MIFPLAEDFLKTLRNEKLIKINPKSIFHHKYLVACRFELASSMSGSGEGLGDFDDDCIESVASGVSNVFMILYFGRQRFV